LKLLNFRAADHVSFGMVVAEGVVDLGRRLKADGADLVAALRAGSFASLDPAAQPAADYDTASVQVLLPTGRGSRYFCVGINYPDRNEEYRDGSERPKYPSIFMRSHTSFAAHGEPILRPRESEQLDYEGEIAVIIGQGGRRIPEQDALRHVFGYTCANEGSVRDWLRHSKFNVTPGKNFDRSGSLGPYIVTADEIGTRPMQISTRVNGELRQQDSSDRMIFPLPYLISYLSTFCSLEPGDVLLTGTPTGAGVRLDPPRYLQRGDRIEVEVTRVGLLQNTVVDDVG
jgi:2-keto-4-pentenoate hydratase/2-oxohepta-3-ene-1,7-dioic acid hydratase in catechol pathway